MRGRLVGFVEFEHQSRLLSGSVVLVQNTLACGSVNLLNGGLDNISLVGSVGLKSNVSLLDGGLESRGVSLVALCSDSGKLYTLLSRLDIRHRSTSYRS